jgi:hypothetical protein
VRIVENRKNNGVALACNQGAALARGEFVVFLNTDALVHSGWLPPLLETVTSSPLIGAAGPRFLNLDGTIQEAGALLLRDATTLAYGNRCPDTPGEFHRLRVVDYISNACFLIGRSVFNRVGGFDPAYTPAYYSDVDLCLRLAALGYLTAYEPRSTVTHVFGWAGEKSVNEAVLTRNRAFFARRWSRLLASRPPLRPEGTRQIVASRDAPLLDRLLVVAERTPEEKSRNAALVRELAGLYPTVHVALLAEDATPTPREDIRSVEFAPVEGKLERADDWLADRRFHYDLVLSLSPGHGPLEQAVRSTQPQASWIVDLGPETEERIVRDGTGEGLEEADAVLVASTEARQAVAARLPLPVFIAGGEPAGSGLREALIHFGFAAGAVTEQDRSAPSRAAESEKLVTMTPAIASADLTLSQIGQTRANRNPARQTTETRREQR